ncbi:GNAT family N-acetyltransferase [Actinokineospora cianjurensis]|uniref:Acetyltransferase (GNAT) family protein n=1 Tax=Actinokineospora cianjurensis TaxID=585224 RepID=A0A421AWQ3_9PSEU|nr:GNAT family N-acetyltransferase [Actinokineospora cianjurensis]RLK54242.1 acetyltransferase (GNAT) family protein [Actinokineospora cianjurensis]
MRVVRHTNLHDFWSAVEHLYSADPIRHTVAMTVLTRLRALPELPADIMLLTTYDGDALTGASFQFGPWPLALSGLPTNTHDAVIAHLLDHGHTIRRAQGPRDVADHFTDRWTNATGTTVERLRSERLFRLGDLVHPTVEGQIRFGTIDDLELLGRWCTGFSDEALDGDDGLPDPVEFARDAVVGGRGVAIWTDGVPVAMAMATKPVRGMSRIGPVYTPKEHRGHGYASAVTAAAARWARERGADDVLLFADLDNPVANSIYQRIGFRPVFEAVEATFAGRNTLEP